MKTLTDQQKLEILCAYLPHGVEFKLPIESNRFDSITEGEPWRLVMTIQDAIKENIDNTSRYETMTLKQSTPSIMWDDGEMFLGQMISSLGFEEDDVYLKEVKLILRHPDDMTEEEVRRTASLLGYSKPKFAKWWLMGDPYDVSIKGAMSALNYLHSIHIDTFDAIEAGFAVRKNINETTQLRVRFQPNDCDEVFTGTVIESRKHSYLVVPDDNLTGTAHWSKLYCEIIKGN